MEGLNKNVQCRDLTPIIFIIFCFLLFYLPLDFGGHTFRSQVLFIVFIFLSACLYILFNKKFLGDLRQFLYPALLMLAALIVSLCVSSYIYASLTQSLLFVAYFLVFVMAANAFGNVGARRAVPLLDKFPAALAAAVITVAMAGLYFYKITNEAGFASDFYSTFYQKNICAGFLIMVLPVLLSLYLTHGRLLWSVLFGISAYFSAVGLLFTQSRLGWMIFFVVSVFLLINLYGHHLRKKEFFIKFGILFVLLFISIPLFSIKTSSAGAAGPSSFLKEETKSIATIEDPSKLARLEFYRIALKEFMDHPIAGVGLENFGYYYPKYEKDPRFYSKFVHNFYLEILCSLGILGFLALSAILFLLVKGYLKALKLSKNTQYYPLILGLASGCASSLFHIAADVDWLFASIPFYFFFFSGVIFYYSNFLEDNRPTSADEHGKTAWYNYAGIAVLMILSIILLIFHMAEISAVTGKYYKEKNDFSAAIYNYKKAAKFNPLNVDYHKQLAGLYFYENSSVLSRQDTTDKLNNAIRHARAAIRLERLKPNNYILLARLYNVGAYCNTPLREKLYIETLQAALRVDWINYPSVYNDLALYYLEKNDTAYAKEMINKIIPLYKDEYFNVMLDFRRDEIKKQISDSYVVLASAESLQNLDAEAKKHLIKALELNRNNFSANVALGMIYYNNKEYDNAAKYLRRAMRAYGNTPSRDPAIKRVNEVLGECEKAENRKQKTDDRN